MELGNKPADGLLWTRSYHAVAMVLTKNLKKFKFQFKMRSLSNSGSS